MSTFFTAIKKHRYSLLLLLSIAILLVIKIPDLFLPCFWDEACPYSVAIYDLYNHGLSISPGAIDPEVYRGHPILYHFLQVLWMKIFGSSLPVAKTFPLFVSVMLLITIFQFCKRIFNEKIAITAVIFILIQPVFLAQATFLLPEMLLALFAMLTLYGYINGNKILYLLACSALMMTKETGVVLFIAIMLFHLIDFFRSKDRRFFPFLKSSLFLMIPILPVAAFFIAQKIIHGWFLFPFHIELLDNSNLAGKIFRRFEFIFFNKANIILFIVAAIFLILSIYRIIKKRGLNLSLKQENFFIIFAIFAPLFIVFCAINFFTPRYTLCIMPMVMIVYAYCTLSLFNFKPLLSLIPICGMIISFFFINLNPGNSCDHTLAYRNAIYCHSEAVKYLEDHDYYDKHILTHFLMRVNLGHSSAGYRSNNIVFPNVTATHNENTEYFIISDTEYSTFHELKGDDNLQLIKRFEKGRAFTEIYKRNP